MKPFRLPSLPALRAHPTWVVALMLLLLPQIPFWVSGFGLTSVRPVFNLDLVVAILVGSWFRRTGMILLVLTWIVDAVRAISLTYHFFSPLDLLRSVRFVNLVDIGLLISWPMLLGLFCLLLVGLAIRQYMPAAPRTRWILLFTSCLLCTLDIANGSSQVLSVGREHLRTTLNVLGSPGLNTYRAISGSWRVTDVPMRSLPNPVANIAVRQWHDEHPSGSVLLVLVESLGQPVSDDLTGWLQSRLVTPAVVERWLVSLRSDAFAGSTTYGELRVLCGVYGHYSQLPEAASNGDCLPLRMSRAGFRIQALHGFDLRMFDRQNWWPRLGLNPYVFKVSERAGAARTETACNEAFAGICDRIVLRNAVQLAAKPAQFVYALTLDTHLPLAPYGALVDDSLRPLCQRNSVPDDACLMVARLGSVLEGLREELLANDAAPFVVVVGDHSPPFVSVGNRNAFIEGRVPVWILTPH